jgi:hypothetical protein
LAVDQQSKRRFFIHRQVLVDFVNQLVLEKEAHACAYQKAQEKEQPNEHPHQIAFSISKYKSRDYVVLADLTASLQTSLVGVRFSPRDDCRFPHAWELELWHDSKD